MKKVTFLTNSNPAKTTLYADFSEWTINNTDIPNVIVFAGIIIDDSSIVKLSNEISRIKEQIKAPYKDVPNLPLKWCFGDLKNFYEDKNLGDLYKHLLKTRTTWLNQISDMLNSISFNFIISIIKCYAKNRTSLKKTKDMVIGFAFSNCLMKYGFYIKKNNLTRADVIIDWPQKDNKKLYEEEYRTAFYFGRSAKYGCSYKCGPLRNLGFNESLFFSSTTECSVLQIADLIAGAFKDILKQGLEDKDSKTGNEFIQKIKYKLLGAPNNLNYSIAVAPPKKEDPDFYRRIWHIIKNKIFNYNF